jgi:hypothetical protein
MTLNDNLLIDAGTALAETRSANDVASGDWDEQVRQAFFVACMGHEIRAEVARRELTRAASPEHQRELGAALLQSAALARSGWETIDRCLAVHGELAALALDRCLEETALQLRRPSGFFAPGASGALLPRRSRSLVADHPDIAESIIGRARERLIWFRARRLHG